MIHLRQAAVAALVSLTPVTASAGLEICNETSVKHTVAVGYKDGEDWVSEGWWNISPGSCATPLQDDLKSRFYYYRTVASGRDFQDDNIAFCTVDKVFTIVGDDDCTARGYEQSLFAKIDTGSTAKHFIFTITDTGTAPAPTPQPAPIPAPTPQPTQTPAPTTDTSSTEPGTYGRVFVASANLQECLNSDDEAYCSFFSDAGKFFVADDGRTPSNIFASLRSLELGSPITIEGDIVAVYDHSSEIVLRSVTTRAWSAADIMIDKMQGQWYAVDDADAQFTISGLERLNTNNGAITSTDYLSVQDSCTGFEDNEAYLYAREVGTGKSLCYVIETVDDLNMILTSLPNGNRLKYRKLE